MGATWLGPGEKFVVGGVYQGSGWHRAFLLLSSLVGRRPCEALSFLHPKGPNGKVAAVVEVAQGVVGLRKVADEIRDVLRSQTLGFTLIQSGPA